MPPGMKRRYAAEFIGTFALVFFGCGSIITAGPGGDSGARLAVNLVFGFTVGALVYALGHISAAHFNPAVTLGFAVARRFPWRYVAPYWLSQCTGAVTASALHFLLLPEKAAMAHYGATVPSLSRLPTAGLEALLTFFLVLVIISVATDRRVDGAVPGLAIGLTVVFCGLFGGPLTGAGMNPARSLAPAIFAGGTAWAAAWLYVVGPMLGAAVGARAYEVIRGGDEHAKGAPNDLFIALQELRQEA